MYIFQKPSLDLISLELCNVALKKIDREKKTKISLLLLSWQMFPKKGGEHDLLVERVTI